MTDKLEGLIAMFGIFHGEDNAKPLQKMLLENAALRKALEAAQAVIADDRQSLVEANSRMEKDAEGWLRAVPGTLDPDAEDIVAEYDDVLTQIKLALEQWP